MDPVVVFFGPPGSGKTLRINEWCAAQAAAGKRVLHLRPTRSFDDVQSEVRSVLQELNTNFDAWVMYEPEDCAELLEGLLASKRPGAVHAYAMADANWVLDSPTTPVHLIKCLRPSAAPSSRPSAAPVEAAAQ